MGPVESDRAWITDLSGADLTECGQERARMIGVPFIRSQEPYGGWLSGCVQGWLAFLALYILFILIGIL